VWRILKLLTNLVISSFVFNYFITILVIILNPFVQINKGDFIVLFLDLFVFYGPLWIFVIWIIFYLLQFFSEKKINVGIIKPPTLIHFLFFGFFISSIIIYLNYDYYFIQFTKNIKSIFIEILLVNMIIIIASIFLILSKSINKKWLQIAAITAMFIGLLNTFYLVNNKKESINIHYSKKVFKQNINPRKIRIVIMNGLSLNTINSIRTENKLLNFDYLLKNGVAGKISLFKPNLNISLLNSAFTGKLPSQLPYHSNYKFKFRSLQKEFNIFPRYIFFRYSSKLKFSFFYKKNDEPILDNIVKYYVKNKYKTQNLINPIYIPTYFSKNITNNTKFIKHFSEIIKNKNNPKYNLLKKTFFYDDYIKSRIIELKDSDFYYSVMQFKGLDIISKYFSQFYMSSIFGDIEAEDVNKYKWVLKKYYEFYDSIIGNLISSMGDDELLVLLSLYEYEPLPVWRRILANILGNREVYMYKSLSSVGTIFLYEKNAIKKGYPVQGMSIYDFFPTMIYYSGFTLSKDLNGKIIREIFLDDFLLNNPIDIRTN